MILFTKRIYNSPTFRLIHNQESTVWYDREDVHKDAHECRSSLKEAHKVVEHLIAEEGKEGISPENIVIGES